MSVCRVPWEYYQSCIRWVDHWARHRRFSNFEGVGFGFCWGDGSPGRCFSGFRVGVYREGRTSDVVNAQVGAEKLDQYAATHHFILSAC